MEPRFSIRIAERLGAVGARRALGGAAAIAVAGLAFMLPTQDRRAEPAATIEAVVEVAEAASAVRAGFGPEWDLPNLDHERVDYWIERFTTVPDMIEKMEGFLERSGRYVPMLLEKLAERDMPQDLIFLAMIESGFEPRAYSSASASGLWQFIAETGRRYGLAIDRAVDERNDPIRATDAALDYLTELHERFGSWYLAAAAYNTGENRVGRIMRETFGRERARSEDEYYRIWPRLPRETRDYVPLMIAAGRIGKDLEAHGFAHIGRDAPLAFDEVVLPPATSLGDVARAAGVSLAALRELNPHFRLDRTPDNRDYPVRLPSGALPRFAMVWGAGVEAGPALAE